MKLDEARDLLASVGEECLKLLERHPRAQEAFRVVQPGLAPHAANVLQMAILYATSVRKDEADD